MLNNNQVYNIFFLNLIYWNIFLLSFKLGSISNNLRGVDVPVISNDDCDTYLYYRGAIHPGMICMGYLEAGGYDSCQVSFNNYLV